MSTWIPSLTLGIGRGERQKRYLAAMEKLVVEEKRKLRNDTIEDCARVCEGLYHYYGPDCAAAIRSLKDKP